MNFFSLTMILFTSKIVNYFACYYTQSIIFSISMLIQQIIILSIPVYIFFSIYTSTLLFPISKKSFAINLIVTIFMSNFCNLFIFTNITKYTFTDNIANNDIITIKSLSILFSLPIKKIFSNYMMILSGLILGIIIQIYKNSNKDNEQSYIHLIDIKLHQMFKYIQYFIANYLKYLMYIMLIGIFTNIIYSEILTAIIYKYYNLILLIAIGFGITISAHLVVIYLTNKYSIIHILKNVMTPISIAAPAMSSSLSIPSNIEATIKNTKDPVYSNFIIPIITNVHLNGDTIIISMLNIITLLIFNYPIPEFYIILSFAFYGAIYKFSSAAVPAGGIIVMHPLLISIFGYSPEMIAFITSIYILLDIVATTGNIMYNNLMAVILHYFYSKINTEK